MCDQGYCHFPGILTPDMLTQLRRATDALLDAVPARDRERFRYQGSNIAVTLANPVLAKLVSWPASLQALASLGYDAPKYWSGYIISKPPHAPPLYWHQDWAFWDDPISAEPDPAQLFLMYYLVDTNRDNGCLRVIPESHRRRLPFHDQLPSAHTNATYEANPDSIVFSTHPDEVDVPVRAGDLLVGDARVLHAAHANASEERRTLLTLWYFPRWRSMSVALQAGATKAVMTHAPSSEVKADWESLLLTSVEHPNPVPFNRVPGSHLKP
ncbi:MAG: phytanoyl-CoA dioxygenase family protein [Phycisphaeraceae bacterium]|nr:phytanoyl-CoA dioxygenase family protein [Phycisphaeraceae bacterium]